MHPDQSEQVPALIKHCSSVVKNDRGKIHRTEDWGRRQLAYPIAKTHKAHYVLMNIECTDKALRELEEFFRLGESVLRKLIVSVSKIYTEPSVIKLSGQEDGEDQEGNQPEEGWSRQGSTSNYRKRTNHG